MTYKFFNNVEIFLKVSVEIIKLKNILCNLNLLHTEYVCLINYFKMN